MKKSRSEFQRKFRKEFWQEVLGRIPGENLVGIREKITRANLGKISEIMSGKTIDGMPEVNSRAILEEIKK